MFVTKPEVGAVSSIRATHVMCSARRGWAWPSARCREYSDPIRQNRNAHTIQSGRALDIHAGYPKATTEHTKALVYASSHPEASNGHADKAAVGARDAEAGEAEARASSFEGLVHGGRGRELWWSGRRSKRRQRLDE